MFKEALRTFEDNFGQPQAVVSAHLDTLSPFPSLKMHDKDYSIRFSATISSLVGDFKSLSFDADLKSFPLPKKTGQKLPLNKKSWSFFTVKKLGVQSTILDFSLWLKQKAEAHDLLKQTSLKGGAVDNTNSVNKTKVASRIIASNLQTEEKHIKNRLQLHQYQAVPTALFVKETTALGTWVN